MTVEQIIAEIETLVATSFNDGIRCGHDFSTRFDRARCLAEHREEIAELRSKLSQLILTASEPIRRTT